MENASKALIIAGGMLIGIIIASIFSYEMIHMSESARVYYEQTQITQITEFNAQFEKYANKELRSQDIVTIIGYVTEWNSQNTEKIIAVAETEQSTELYKYINKTGNYAGGNSESDSLFLSSNSGVEKEYICKLSYSSDTGGRVNKITFKYK